MDPVTLNVNQPTSRGPDRLATNGWSPAESTSLKLTSVVVRVLTLVTELAKSDMSPVRVLSSQGAPWLVANSVMVAAM